VEARDLVTDNKGDRAGQWSIRVNDQFRICFRWTGTDAEAVEIVDYH
jgi:proteic killer suppression protein